MSLELWDRTEQTEASSWCLLENRTLDGYYVFFMNLRFSYLIFSFCFVCWICFEDDSCSSSYPKTKKTQTYFWCPFKLLQSHECTRFLVEGFVLHYFIASLEPSFLQKCDQKPDDFMDLALRWKLFLWLSGPSSDLSDHSIK